MAISGYLSEFSLPEIFQLLEQGNKTGRLSVQERSQNSSSKGLTLHIWFKQGHIIAAADRLDGQGLVTIIQQRGWISSRVAARIAEVCAINQPAGLCLKEQGLLEAEQLKLLFSQQVLQQVCKLFELQDGYFQFDHTMPLPIAEMTGLTAPAKEVTLAGLRVLRDWTMLQSKLPPAASGLVNATAGKPQLRLNQLEWQVWEFANGNVPIQDIAKQLQLPTQKIQQVAFRLMVVGLVDEVPLLIESSDQEPNLELSMLPMEEKVVVAPASFSPSFLQSLVGFLKGKV
ncbi:MAG: DUF4388 domain-containing protein [Lyngbya sp. HA4199-MV5]|jgi:hypothetical protein|nr:DUF4388 domain-containing protein [Lyngbya sp. HA4199-MV5]